MAEYLHKALSRLDGGVEMVDLRQMGLPLCDGDDESHDPPNVVALKDKIEEADAIAIAVPIYNYDVGGAARNLVAVTGKVWTEKVLGFVGAAGGERSYMSLMSLANSLMFDFRSIVVPRYVYASSSLFEGTSIASSGVCRRLNDLAADLDRFARAFARFPPGEAAVTTKADRDLPYS